MKSGQKILTLGLEKKRAWQLPLLAGLLVVFGLGVRWWYNSRAVQGIRLLVLLVTSEQLREVSFHSWKSLKVGSESENSLVSRSNRAELQREKCHSR